MKRFNKTEETNEVFRMRCRYCGKEIHNWKELEETKKGCRFYCSLECCYLDHPNPSCKLQCPCF